MRRGTWLASGFSFLFFVSSAWATDVPLQDLSYQTTRTESLGNFFEDGDLVGSVKEKAGYTYTPYVGLSYALIPELLSGSLHYQHSFEGAIKTFDGESGASDGTFIGRADDFIELSLRVLWF